MQKLHLVGFTPDHDGLILSTRKGAKSGGFVVPVDTATLERLVETSRTTDASAPAATPAARTNGRRAAHDPRPTRPESHLGPREMQELLRGGWTLDEVAAEAGVDVDWVSRFAAPVLAEQHRVLDRALECTFDKPRVGPSALPLAASVRRNAAERGIRFSDEDFDDAWRAAQMYDDIWLIGFDYTSRGREQSAEWVIDLEIGELTSNNRLGTQLGYVQSARRKVDTSPPPKPKPKATRATTKAGAATKRRAPVPATTPARARSRASAGSAKKAAAKRGTSRAKSKPHGAPPDAASQEVPAPSTAPAPPRRRDPWREELRRRELERSAALAARLAGEPAPEPAPERERPPAPRDPSPPVAIIGPTVRLLRRRRPPTAVPAAPAVPPAPAPERQPEDEPEQHTKGPLPAPAPLPVPEEIRERASHTLGLLEEDEDDDLAAFEEELHLDAEPSPPPTPPPAPPPIVRAPPVRHAAPVFRGAQAAATAPVVRRRRTEPLRAR